METQEQQLNDLVAAALAACEQPGNEAPPPPDTTVLERFYELMVLSLANLFPRMPFTGQIYDRTILMRIIMGMDEAEAAGLGKRTDDWLRLEGMIKQEEGKRSYYLPRTTQAALSTMTPHGMLGLVFAKILKRYTDAAPSDELRKHTRSLCACFLLLLEKD